MTGTIKKIGPYFGFIHANAGDVFLHRSEFAGDFRSLRVGDAVEFTLAFDDSGRAKAHGTVICGREMTTPEAQQ